MEMHAEPKSNRFNRVNINFNLMLNVLSVNLYIIPLLYIVVKISYRHKRPCNANTNFRDNRIWKLDHFQSARIVYYHLN